MVGRAQVHARLVRAPPPRGGGAQALSSRRATWPLSRKLASAIFAIPLLTAALTHASPEGDTARIDVAIVRERAARLENAGDYAGALAEWYRLIDTASTTSQSRAEARGHVHALLDRVPRNLDATKAATWRLKVFIFESTRLAEGTGDTGTPEVHADLSADDTSVITSSIAAFQDLVFMLTRGKLRVETTFERVSSPVTRFEVRGFGRFERIFVTPTDLPRPVLENTDGIDSVFAYVVLGQKGQALPSRTALAATYGATFPPCSVFHCRRGLCDGTGEIELHEWLHQVKWALSAVQGWPDSLVPSPDWYTTTRRQDPC